MLDHGVIVNPKDDAVIDCAVKTGSKIWYMGLNGSGEYCNPSAENISKEIFLAMQLLFLSYENLRIHKIKLWETPNCSVTCKQNSISDVERNNWLRRNQINVLTYAKQKGIMEYDDRKSQPVPTSGSKRII
jgi:6-pyruvoyltetrahydropterin/6-carboxytetrahydropterin synthase